MLLWLALICSPSLGGTSGTKVWFLTLMQVNTIKCEASFLSNSWNAQAFSHIPHVAVAFSYANMLTTTTNPLLLVIHILTKFSVQWWAVESIWDQQSYCNGMQSSSTKLSFSSLQKLPQHGNIWGSCTIHHQQINCCFQNRTVILWCNTDWSRAVILRTSYIGCPFHRG